MPLVSGLSNKFRAVFAKEVKDSSVSKKARRIISLAAYLKKFLVSYSVIVFYALYFYIGFIIDSMKAISSSERWYLA